MSRIQNNNKNKKNSRHNILSHLIEKMVKKESLCNGYCSRVKTRFSGCRLNRKGLGSFSCNHCELFLPLVMLDTMYHEDKQIIEIILNSKTTKYGLSGIKRLEKLQKNGRFCFCCGMKFSLSHKGSYVADKRDELELVGLIQRY